MKLELFKINLEIVSIGINITDLQMNSKFTFKVCYIVIPKVK